MQFTRHSRFFAVAKSAVARAAATASPSPVKSASASPANGVGTPGKRARTRRNFGARFVPRTLVTTRHAKQGGLLSEIDAVAVVVGNEIRTEASGSQWQVYPTRSA